MSGEGQFLPRVRWGCPYTRAFLKRQPSVVALLGSVRSKLGGFPSGVNRAV
jgi:hypothetical protein